MKKNLRKTLSKLLPKGRFKDQLKLWFYNNSTSLPARFSLEGAAYGTKFGQNTFITTSPLYRVVEDFDFYTHFYKPGGADKIIDAGANQGFISLYFASLIDPNGIVWSFEPDSKNIDTINKNMALNPDKAPRIEIVDLLLWDKDEMVEFYEAGSVGSSAHYIPDNNNIVMKRATTLDNWVRENGILQIDFIKMDIEGAELEAIKGALETIKNFKPDFAIASYHIINGEPTFIKLEKIFESIGYPYKTIHFNKKEIITFAGPSVETKI